MYTIYRIFIDQCRYIVRKTKTRLYEKYRFLKAEKVTNVFQFNYIIQVTLTLQFVIHQMQMHRPTWFQNDVILTKIFSDLPTEFYLLLL